MSTYVYPYVVVEEISPEKISQDAYVPPKTKTHLCHTIEETTVIATETRNSTVTYIRITSLSHISEHIRDLLGE